jgi:hypothetical protein
MTERRGRPGPDGTENNAKDEQDESQKHGRKRDATKEAVEEEVATGGSGGVKDNVEEERDKS